MRTKTAAWAAPLLPLLAAALLLPARGPLARDDVSLADVRPNPIDEQWMDYEQGRKAWMEALEPNRTAKSRQKLYDCAERHLLEAAAGPSHFPEAELALGILYYNRNMPYKAETVFQHVGGGPSTRGIARGAIRAEARTYMGALALRCRHWQDARAYFEGALREDPGSMLVAAHDKRYRERNLRTWMDRAARVRPAARVGVAVATYYMAVAPAHPAPTAPDYVNAWQAVNDLLSGGDVTLDPNVAVLWRYPEQMWPRTKELPGVPEFPAARPNWDVAPGSPAPSGVAVVSVREFGNAVQTYSASMLDVLRSREDRSSTIPVRDAAASSTLTVLQDRRNAAMGLIRRILWLEGSPPTTPPNWAAVLPLLDQLEAYGDVDQGAPFDPDYPRIGLIPRQHRIWIALHGIPDTARARQLIDGAGAAEDPLIYNEIFTLAQALAAAGDNAGAIAEWQRVVAGVPGSSVAAVKARQDAVRAEVLPYAQLNLAVRAYGDPGTTNWGEVAGRIPRRPGAEELTVFTALRWADATVRTRGSAADLGQAFALADSVVNGTLGSGTRSLPYRGRDVSDMARLLAIRAHENGSADTYRSVLEPRARDIYAHFRAIAAVDRYNQSPSAASAATLRTELEQILQQFPSLTVIHGTLSDLAAQPLGSNPRAQAAYSRGVELKIAWDQAVERTNSRDYRAAASQWGSVVGMIDQNREDLAMAYPNLAELRTRADAYRGDAERAAGAGRATEGVTESRGEVRFHEYTGPDLPYSTRRDRGAVFISARDRRRGRITVSPTAWLNALGRPENRRYLQALVDWFNGGEPNLVALRNQQVSRFENERVATGWTADSLLAFLNERLYRRAGVLRGGAGNLPRGARQYGYHPGSGDEWVRSKVPFASAAYFLTRGPGDDRPGRAIINAYCSNPIDLIVRRMIPVPPPSAETIPAPTEPRVTYERVTLVRPVQEFTYAPFETWKLAGRSVGTAYYPVCPPALVLLVRAAVAPKLPIDRIYVPPHCNPSRITIGRVSTIDAWRYPLRVKWGTAESRKR